MLSLMRDFLRLYGKAQKKQMIFLTLGSILVGFLELMGIILIFPLIALVSSPQSIHNYRLLQILYDKLALTSDKPIVLMIAGSIAGIFIFKNIFTLFFQYRQQCFLASWKNDMCEKLMSGYLHASYEFHLKRSSKDLINVLNNVVFYALDSFILQAILIFSNVVTVGILAVFLFVKYFIPTIVTTIILGSLLFIQTRYFRRVTNRINREFVTLREKNFGAMQNGLIAIKDTKMSLKETFFLDKYATTNRRVTDNDRIILLFRYVPPVTTEIVLIFSVIVMSCIVLYYSPSKTTAVANLGVLAALGFRMAPLINRSLNSFVQMNSSKDAIKKLIDEYPVTVSKNSDLVVPCSEAKPLELRDALELKNISFCYPQSKQVAINNINLKVEVGEFLGIVGRSGVGKTTVVDILMGLLTPTTGEYLLDGKPVSSQLLKQLRRNIGYVHQSVHILDGTVRENVAFGCEEKDIDDDKVKKAIERAQLYDVCSAMPKGIYSPLGEQGKNLSGGQKQRIGIARALYHEPAIIVLDEATSALDVETEHAFTSMISQFKQKKTIIAIAHRLSTLKQCDRLVYMENGSIKATDTFANLTAAFPNFARLADLSEVRVSESLTG